MLRKYTHSDITAVQHVCERCGQLVKIAKISFIVNDKKNNILCDKCRKMTQKTEDTGNDRTRE